MAFDHIFETRNDYLDYFKNWMLIGPKQATK